MFLVAAILHALAHPRHRAEVGPLTVYRFEANPITGRFEERRVS